MPKISNSQLRVGISLPEHADQLPRRVQLYMTLGYRIVELLAGSTCAKVACMVWHHFQDTLFFKTIKNCARPAEEVPAVKTGVSLLPASSRARVDLRFMPLRLARPPSRPPSHILTSLLACLSTTWAAKPGTMTVCVHNATVHNATGHNEGVDACEGDCEVHACIWVLSSSDDGGVHSSCQEGMASGYDGSDDKCWARCQTATVEEDSDAVDWSGECSCCSFDWVDGDSEVQVRAPLPYTSMESSSPVASHPHTSS